MSSETGCGCSRRSTPMPKCLSPDCNGQTPNKKLATCNTCRKVNCHSCHAIHEGIACRVYQESIGGGERLDKRGKITEGLVKTEARKQDEDVAKKEASPSKVSTDSRASPKGNASPIRTNSS
uniref:Putative ranbp-type and c3hc4-type zinc finger n=1 Tax=Ixodes ricinus TaxID=34613 RepID=A0A0K8RBE2_IXORI